MSAETLYQSEFVRFWNETLVPKFVRFQHILVEGLGQHSRVVFARGPVAQQGEQVLDVGCGFGDTAIELARQVGSEGRVVGLDCCQAFLDCGIEEAARAGVKNIEWVLEDAETYDFGGKFDLWFSRFGTMFFTNPVFAMRNLKRALKPGGRVMMIVWREREDNVWSRVPRQVVLEHLPEPENPDTCGPGPFSMASTDLVTKQMQAAGYQEIEFERHDAPIMVGRTVQEAIDFQLAIGPAGEIYREAGEITEKKDAEIRDALARALEPYVKDEGVVLPSSSWCVTARAAK